MDFPVCFFHYFMSDEPSAAKIKSRTLRSRNKAVSGQFYLGSEFGDLYLTQREADCMALLMKGHTNLSVAKQLKLSARTVEFYIKNMRQKLGCHNKAHLIQTVQRTNFSYQHHCVQDNASEEK